MSEPKIEHCIARLNLIRLHLQHAGIKTADHHLLAALDELVRVSEQSIKLNETPEDPGTAH